MSKPTLPVAARHWAIGQLVPLAIFTVIIAAVVGVAGLRDRAERGHQAELLLVRLEGLTQQQYAQLGRALAEGSAGEDLLHDVRSSRASFDEALLRLQVLDGTTGTDGLDARVADFRRSSDLTLRMISDGQASLAASRVQSDAGIAARHLLDRLSRAAAESGERADDLERRGDMGSLMVLLAAACIVWLLLRQAGRARRQADRSSARAARQERFRSLVQHSSDVITITDAMGKIVYQSPSVTPVFGYQPEDLVGTELQSLVHPDDVRSVVKTLIETAKTSSSERIECRVRSVDGAWRHVESAVTARLDDPAIKGMVINTRDITERKELEDQLAHQAFHDSLTGLANRALFRDRVNHALERMRRRPHPVAVLLLDLDGFKTVNDSLGHAFGDDFLVAVADRLRTCCDLPTLLPGSEAMSSRCSWRI